MGNVGVPEIERVFREEYGRAVSVLVRAFGDIDVAEEAVQDAFARAVERWPKDGVPPSPAGWIITTARNRAIDQFRREAVRGEKHVLAAQNQELEAMVRDEPLEDDRLRLMFTCCHPALSMPAQVALTLRLLGGLTTGEIARAFLVSESTMAQRLVRAKAKIRDARIPYRVPERSELPARLDGVLAVVYLVYNEGYKASTGDRLVRDDLSQEAIRLGRMLAGLLPREPEVVGLLALMLLLDSRRPARLSAKGELILLSEQDRRLWDRALIAEGQALVRQCLEWGRPGRYQIQAAINAVHSDARDAGSTDWRQIVQLYDQLLEVAPSPLVAMNRAIAVAEVEGAAAGLRILEQIELGDYYLFHAARADMLRRLGRVEGAEQAYATALRLVDNAAERAFLERRLGELRSE